MAGEVLLNISKDEREQAVFRSLMDNMGLPFERAMRILNVSETEAPEYRELLKNDNFLKS